MSASLTDADPVPFRDQLFRIRVADMSGRSSGPTGGRTRPPRTDWSSPEGVDPDSDTDLARKVEATLADLPLSPASRVHVDAFDGVIALSGAAEDSAERAAVETAVLGVPGVRALVQQLETTFPRNQQPTPAEIAAEALRELEKSPRVTNSGIRIIEEHGWLRVEGSASSRKTRDDVLRRLRGVRGSRGVIDRLRVTGSAAAEIVGN